MVDEMRLNWIGFGAAQTERLRVGQLAMVDQLLVWDAGTLLIASSKGQ